MLNNDKIISVKDFKVKQGSKIKLKDFSTGYTGKTLNKADSLELLEKGRKHLSEIQDKLYAHNRYSTLIIFQAMDAAGKDGAVKHIMSGFNPLGVKVYSFKAPNSAELDHDYFWRHEIALPARGEIAIHNRSHYENVLVTQVHPEFVIKENIPGIEKVTDIDKNFWSKRYKQIRRFEKNLSENGTIILKFFLHVSKKEQKKRFLERINDKSKNWKFSLADLKERGFWDDYQKVYADVLSETSTVNAPWFVIPADDKWFARLAIASVITRQFDNLNLSYPTLDKAQQEQLQKAKIQLESEDGNVSSEKKKAEPKPTPKKAPAKG
jgi:PPK2 family polyphosphate:nucleotide phosphotransferase